MIIERLLAVILYAVLFNVQGANPKYPVNDIPSDLRKDVNAVVRDDKTIFKIISKSKGKVYCHFVITIFNGKAKSFASHTLGYDKLTKIVDFNANVYDADGNLIKKLRNKEISDQSAYDGFSLYSDNRLKHVDLSQASYPYTVEFEYEKEYNFLYGIDGAYIIPDENVAVQRCVYQLIFPADLAPRYKTVNFDLKPTHQKINDGTEYFEWRVENVKPIRAEPHGPTFSQLTPRVMAAPSHFEYSGYEGNMSTWEDYGKWQMMLNKGRDLLPEETKQKIRELTSHLKSVEEKTKTLYEYLQSKTRYVSIALGIGGLQPFDAAVVDKVGYGDCKALSNYMVAMLKEAGITAYYTKIMAGDNAPEIQIDFPSHQTNHIIVAVPNNKDTLWLECTSQTNPFGYLGKFTGNRKAIMITDQGGVIVNTPAHNADLNIKSTVADVEVEANGNASAKIKTFYSGLKYEEGHLDAYIPKQYDDQRKWILNNTDIPSFDVNSFNMIDKKSKSPEALVERNLTLKRYATVMGKRIFLTPNLMNRSTYLPEKVDERKTNVVRKMTYIDLDTIRYHLPEGIYPEFLPDPVSLNSAFGEYEASFNLDQGNLIYTRKVKMNKGEFPAESYQELINFFKGINKADNTKLVFLNKT